MKFPRRYQDLDRYLEPNKVLILYGPRQVGKTTLLQDYLKRTTFRYKLDSGDNIRIQHIIGSQDFSQILGHVQGYNLYAIDEAQRIPGVGMGLKIIVDQIPGICVIATESSSFELSGQVGEPLTGRKIPLTLFPLSQLELLSTYNRSELKEKIPEMLVFGSYPSVLSSPTTKRPKLLDEIVHSYLLKDILELERVKGSRVLLDLLRLIAFQVGNEVSLSELGSRVGLDYKTVARYLDLLEQSFVLYNLRGYSRNLRNEVTKKSKYFFLDNGIRNAVISNFNALDLRDDIGKLWENFLVSERLKAQEYKRIYSNNYFWRSWKKQEIDWIEERDGRIFGYEFKFSKARAKIPPDFKGAYPNSLFETIHQENFIDFVG